MFTSTTESKNCNITLNGCQKHKLLAREMKGSLSESCLKALLSVIGVEFVSYAAIVSLVAYYTGCSESLFTVGT
jgi:hypothetical protein